MKKIANFAVLGMILLLVAVASAQINFIGTVYEKNTPFDASKTLSGVDVTVTCNDVSSSATTKSDGTYGVALESCSGELTYGVAGYNVGFMTGSYAGTYDSNKAISLGSDFIYVVDFILTKKDAPASGGSGGGNCISSFWNCPTNWSTCTNGVQTRTCVSNCAVSKLESQACSAQPSEGGVVVEEEEGNVVEPTGFFSAITGAVIGGGAQSWGIAALIILIILALYWIIKSARKGKKK